MQNTLYFGFKVPSGTNLATKKHSCMSGMFFHLPCQTWYVTLNVISSLQCVIAWSDSTQWTGNLKNKIFPLGKSSDHCSNSKKAAFSLLICHLEMSRYQNSTYCCTALMFFPYRKGQREKKEVNKIINTSLHFMLNISIRLPATINMQLVSPWRTTLEKQSDSKLKW